MATTPGKTFARSISSLTSVLAVIFSAIDAGLVVTTNAAVLVEADPDWADSLPETPEGHPAYF